MAARYTGGEPYHSEIRMPAKVYNPTAVAQLWASRMAAAGDKMKAGVQAVTENPAEKAAAKKEQWLQGVQRAAAENKFEDGLRRVTLAGWKQKMLSKGVNNMTTGAREAVADVTAFLTDYLPFAAQVSAEVQSMPSGTVEDSRARMNTAFDRLRSYKRRT